MKLWSRDTTRRAKRLSVGAGGRLCSTTSSADGWLVKENLSPGG